MSAIEVVVDEVLAAEEALPEPDALEYTQETDEVEESEACPAVEGVGEESLAPPDERQAEAIRGLVKIERVNGIPLWWARTGTPRPLPFYVEPGFKRVLERTVKSVQARAPRRFGKLVKITTAGLYTDKTGPHGMGRACDHDSWTFENVEIAPIKQDHASSSADRRRRYWALAALCRSHSSYVLHGEYDADHRDHIHQDNVGSMPFNPARESNVKLVQAVCNHIFDSSPQLRIDGNFGPATRAAMSKAQGTLNVEGNPSDLAVWIRFLRRSARLGFELSVRGG